MTTPKRASNKNTAGTNQDGVMPTNNTPERDELRQKLQKYNWSSDKDYQLAVIAFKELNASHIEAEVTKAYERGKIDEAKICEKARRHDVEAEVLRGKLAATQHAIAELNPYLNNKLNLNGQVQMTKTLVKLKADLQQQLALKTSEVSNEPNN